MEQCGHTASAVELMEVQIIDGTYPKERRQVSSHSIETTSTQNSYAGSSTARGQNSLVEFSGCHIGATVSPQGK